MIECLHSRIAVGLGSVCLVISCAVPGRIRTASEPPSSVESQLTSGEAIYVQSCATSTCHGTQGEGLRAGAGFKVWPLVGEEFQSRHPNAQIVFDVVRSGGEPNLRALTDQEIYDAIAFELSQNQIQLEAPLTASNAFQTYGGAMSGEAQENLFPPSDNATLISPPSTRELPIATEDGRLRLQVDQVAEARAIGNDSGAFLILVLVFEDLSDEPITVGPEFLRLSAPGGELLEPKSMNIQSAIEKFQARTIKPRHGSVGLVTFALPATEEFDQLIYDDGVGKPLTVPLKP